MGVSEYRTSTATGNEALGRRSALSILDAVICRATLPEMLLLQARSRPADIAVRDDHEVLSYSKLADKSGSVALRLRQLGVVPNERVGVFIQSSTDLMVGTWGVLLAGGAYLPLATDYPDERLTLMIRDAGISVIVTHDEMVPRLSELLLPGVNVVSINNQADIPSPPNDGLSFDDLDGDDLAYVIFTSGTTGAPKGVAISHLSIVNQLGWLQTSQAVTAGQVILQKTPVSFDAAQWELLAVCCGATVVMAQPGVYRDPPSLIQQIKRHNVTMLQGVPTLLQALVDHPDFESCTSLKHIFSGGEALTRKLAARILEARPGVRLVNLYGPTECTINATAFTVTPAAASSALEIMPIGTPVAHTQCYVLGPDYKPLPLGDVGELYIGGIQLAAGYLNRPEQTRERFVLISLDNADRAMRMYRTGDLVRQSPDCTLQFVGRADNQVKFRGYRVELDEIRVAIENHDWVKSAAVFVKPHPRTGQPVLLAGIELNPREATLMDQGDHGTHHQSKSSRLQVRAQLSDNGLRSDTEIVGKSIIDLPWRQETLPQRQLVFARKTYRFYDGGALTRDDILKLLSRPQPAARSLSLSELDLSTLGAALRYLGQFKSNERLLPKYGYASPGALYSVQIYLELRNVASLEPGYYYYHPARHQLIKVGQAEVTDDRSSLRLHFVGKTSAIRPVYKNNIVEVLEIEIGHILGLLDNILPGFGLGVGTGIHTPSVESALSCDNDHIYLGSFDLVSHAAMQAPGPVDVFVQTHGDKVDGLPEGQYRYRDGTLEHFSARIVQQRHVIAINQQVYQRASAAVAFVSRAPERWRSYIDLGRALQRHQMNDIGIGLMSSGYSSKSGKDLVAAKRLSDILEEQGEIPGPNYFCLMGKITQEQLAHEGMREDAVHMFGPAELVRKDLQNILPDYMVPSRIVVLDRIPHSASGKVDVEALKRSPAFDPPASERNVVAPRTVTEEAIGAIWRQEMNLDDVSIHDDFFEIGGDSLQAVAIVLEINRKLAVNLPIQILFEDSTIEKLAQRVDRRNVDAVTRLATLRSGEGTPLFIWPGLGGYPLNLRALAAHIVGARPVLGVQALGINPGETINGSIEEMAAADIALIKRVQQDGPYTLWGYSFGARVAYEIASQLEQAGDIVEQLVFIAPGSPTLSSGEPSRGDAALLFHDRSFLTILFSIFAHSIDPDLVEPCLRTVSDEQSFIAYVAKSYPSLDVGLIERIVRLVTATYSPRYGIELRERAIAAPVTILKALGDGTSFLERASIRFESEPRILDLPCDHYAVLKPEGVQQIIYALGQSLQETHAIEGV